MPATPELSSATASSLRSLRIRATVLIALLATVAVVVFAVVVVRIDRQLRDQQIDAELLQRADAAVRLVSFEDAELTPADPTSVLEGVVLAVNPSFSIDEFLAQQERYGLPEPTDGEMEARYADTFFEAEHEVQELLVAEVLFQEDLGEYAEEIDVEELVEEGSTVLGPVVLEEGGSVETLPAVELTLEDALDVVVSNPPEELADEAYRQYVLDAADEAGVELEFETAIYAGDGVSLAERDVVAVADRVVGDASSLWRDSIAGPENELEVRATALRDGPEVRGAVIAVIDPVEFDDAHDRLRTWVIVLAVAIVCGAIVAAWFVAGRTIRPAWRALGQQERFLADAAHELRTPITAIRLTAEAATPESATESLARVVSLSADASDLTDDLLTLARMDADRMELQREPVRLDLLVESAVAAIPGADDVVEVRAGEVVVDADRGLVERAVGNLVRNAMAHGEASATVPARVVVEADGGQAVVRVRDHGPGVDVDVQGQLFERFRSRGGSNGHGLGLPLARWIAQAHGGDLVARSPAEGPGVEFVLILPLARR